MGPHFIDSFSPDVYVRTSLTGRSQHVVERLTHDDIGTHFVERDVGQQPITLSLRQAGGTCGLQSWWLFSSFITWEMTQVFTSRPDANFSVMWHFETTDNMRYLQTIFALTVVYLMTSCSNGKLEEKGFQVSPTIDNSENSQADGLNRDSLKINTRPSSVLLTGIPNVRLTTIYKVNVNKKDNSTFIGSNSFHYRDEDGEVNKGNNWNHNLMPGHESVYGYNLLNISHYDIK